MDDLAHVWMSEDQQRDDQEVGDHEHVHESLPAAEAAGRGDRDQRRGGDRHGEVLADPEVAERQAHPDELGDDRQEVQQEQIADRERTPELAETLEDQPRVADPRNGPQADHHLLVDDQHGDQQQQHPQQARAVVLPGLRIRGDTARVVVADHHDQARAHDRQQRHRPRAPAVALAGVVHADRPECSADVADVRLVQDGGHTLRARWGGSGRRRALGRGGTGGQRRLLVCRHLVHLLRSSLAESHVVTSRLGAAHADANESRMRRLGQGERNVARHACGRLGTSWLFSVHADLLPTRVIWAQPELSVAIVSRARRRSAAASRWAASARARRRP